MDELENTKDIFKKILEHFNKKIINFCIISKINDFFDSNSFYL